MLNKYRHPYNSFGTFFLTDQKSEKYVRYIMLLFKNVMTFVVGLCLLNVQVFPAYSTYFTQPQDTVNVAFIGIQFTDLKQDQQDSISKRIAALIKEVPQFYNIPQADIQDRLEQSLIMDMKNNLEKEDFRKAAKLLNADYIFAGNIENRSNNEESVALVGHVVRYDVTSDNFYNLKIQSFLENFDNELIRIDNQLIQTIAPEQKESFFKRYLPGIIIVAATAVAITIFLGGTEGQNSGGGGGPTPPFKGH